VTRFFAPPTKSASKPEMTPVKSVSADANR
jgi:hypothetical protein